MFIERRVIEKHLLGGESTLIFCVKYTMVLLKGYGNIYFIFCLSIRTVEVIVILVAKFFVACLVSEILKEK